MGTAGKRGDREGDPATLDQRNTRNSSSLGRDSRKFRRFLQNAPQIREKGQFDTPLKPFPSRGVKQMLLGFQFT